MADVLPSVDSALNVNTLTTLWTDEIAPACLSIFKHDGTQSPEVSQKVTELRANIQLMQSYIAKILSDLPDKSDLSAHPHVLGHPAVPGAPDVDVQSGVPSAAFNKRAQKYE